MVTTSRGILFFLLHFVAAFLGSIFALFRFTVASPGGLDGAQLAEAAGFQRAILLELRLGFHGKTGPGNRFEPRLGNLFAGQLAQAVSLLLNALERFLDFIDGVLV